MANYCTVDEIKGELNVEKEDYDDIFQALSAQAKVFIDNFCNREFDSTAETRYFDGSGSPLFIDDLASISGGSDGIFLDEDGDGTYEETMATTDYIFYPLNTYPKTRVKISVDSDYGGFAAGIKKGVKITATWGYAPTVPEPIRRVSIIQVCRWFKRRESAYSDVIGTTEMGMLIMYKGLDPDINLILKPYIKRIL